MSKQIAFIGAGNMARALIGGLLARDTDARQLIAADPSADTRAHIEQDFGIATASDNRGAVAGADIVVLAVKPQVIDQVAEDIAPALNAGSVVVSVAAGIPLGRLRRVLGDRQALVRVMPNTPALYRAGATGMHAPSPCTPKQKAGVQRLFEAVGRVFPIKDEALMDVVTAVSGSGPAYFFALAEALAQAGQTAGLDPETARELANQTAAGAGTMLAGERIDAGLLRRQVTSPGGTTAAALAELDQAGFGCIVQSAVDAAVARARELGAS
ncbi:MAG: pyrroline-5-carboxylate reductase [Xanthomonadaceae bacterium]|nr:pyrroline-5-carboxylate reductase [Xanthomonadaceae bacterium]